MANDSIAVVVDQNLLDRRTVVSILRKEFKIAQVHQSGTARDALAIIKDSDKIAWLISDTDLPDESGFDFVNKARTFPSVASSSIVMVSSRRDREALLLAATAGVSDYVVKPFTSSTLVAKLRKIANGHERRTSRRISVLGEHTANLAFNDTVYDASLLDISLGGCLVRTELLNRGGGCVYDKALVKVEYGGGGVVLEGVLLRTEGDLEDNPDGDTMKAAFRFTNSDQRVIDDLARLIAVLQGKM